ncbi:MAG TPA: FAD-binding oxidoreductase [Crocinitomix sp.]|nr:FAD-binding oxidoreductase [Crocinitomix sp.]
MKSPDFLIVGWGLAGVNMAWQLYFNNHSFVVYDSTKNYSTNTAAGIVNPIVFKRLTKSWQADKLMPYAENFYKKVEMALKDNIITPKHIFKIFNSFEDENNWMVKQSDDRFNAYLLPTNTNFEIYGINAPYGYGEVKTFGNLDTVKFLKKSKLFFLEKGHKFINHSFDYNVSRIDINIIFCEGYDIVNNPFFNYLPLKPTHGDTLIIKTKALKFKDIINKNMFIMHIKDDLYKIGATYNWSLKTPVCTKEGKNELIDKLNQFANFEYSVVSQQAGIRPTVKDRRPLLGTHPENKRLHVFNGLGTKGVMIAPYYSEKLLKHIVNKEEIDKEINITRYEKYL